MLDGKSEDIMEKIDKIKLLNPKPLTLKKLKKAYNKVKYWCNVCQFAKPINISEKEWENHKHI